jgi:hypothetical protein
MKRIYFESILELILILNDDDFIDAEKDCPICKGKSDYPNLCVCSENILRKQLIEWLEEEGKEYDQRKR